MVRSRHPGNGISEQQWIEERFERTGESGIFRPRSGRCGVAYSDGDDLESWLLQTLEKVTDLGVGSLDLERAVRDFPSRYHLTARRANLLRPLRHLLRGRVLEVGSGCGPLTRYLGELGGDVWALEGSARRAHIAASRCRDLPNVRVFAGSIQEFSPPVRFDAVLLIGVLEYSRIFLSGSDSVACMLELCAGLLSQDGVLIVAIENQLGLKYFSGAPEDHDGRTFSGIQDAYAAGTPVTFGRAELERRLRTSGLDRCEFFYPFPDYKLPTVILHPAACKDPELNVASLVRARTAEDQSIPYSRLFSEEMAWPVLARNGLVPELANSFLVVASRGPGHRAASDELASVYSEARRRLYAKETLIVRTLDGLLARRARLYGDLPADTQLVRHEIEDEPVLAGTLWLDRLFPIVNRCGWDHEAVAGWARPWVDYLRQRTGEDGLVPGRFLDCTPNNVIEVPGGGLDAFDLEWIACRPLQIAYIVFRGLFGSLARVRTTAEPQPLPGGRLIDLCAAVMRHVDLPVTEPLLDGFIDQEAEFQEIVAGIGDLVRRTWRTAPLPPVRRVTSGQIVSLETALATLARLERHSAEARAAAETEIAKRDETVLHYRSHSEKLAEMLYHAQTELAETRAVADQRNRELAETRAVADQRDRQLAEASRWQRQVHTAHGAYQALLAQTLRVYRGQRAWKAMLLLRKAYTELVRRGWRGRLAFTGTLLLSPFRGIPGLDRHELAFPDLLDHLPSGLDQPLAAEPAAAPAQSPTPAPEPQRRPVQRAYDIVVLPVFEFDYRFQRPQQLAVRLAQVGHRVFWISPSRPSASEPYAAIPLRDNLWEIHLRAAVPDIYRGSLDHDVLDRIMAGLRQLFLDWAVAENCVLLELPFWRRVGLALRDAFGTRVVFDCMDEWETFPNIGEFNRSEQNQLIREADLLVVTGRGLQDHYARRGASPLLIRNGVDFDFFSAAKPGELPAGVGKPIIGYFGAIADWFDFELLREVARLRPQYSFVLIGGLGMEENVVGESVPRLRELPNIHLLGHKRYQEIPGYLALFDVCIIPFLLNRVTQATDPVKLYEYFSQGKPVVATPMSELEQCGDLVYLAGTAAEFTASLDCALGERGDELKRRRIDFARANTWSERTRCLDGAIGERFELVSILIVTHNSAPFVRPCLEYLLRNTTYPNYEVIVFDNQSADGTQELLQEYAARDARIRVTCLPRNVGFAVANNLAVRQARGEQLILLNADTMVTSGWVDRLLRHARRETAVGMVIPVTNWAGNEARIDVTYRDAQTMEEFALELAAVKAGESTELRVGPLFCALVPRRVWQAVGELDERFTVGMFEDDDFSHRVRRAGLRIVAAEDCFVHHFGQGSFAQLTPERYQEIFELNKRQFEEKWSMPWEPHRYRDGVSAEPSRFTPAKFTAGLAPSE